MPRSPPDRSDVTPTDSAPTDKNFSMVQQKAKENIEDGTNSKNDDKKIEYQILHQKNIQFSGFTKSLFDVKSSILYQFKLEIPFPPPDRVV